MEEADLSILMEMSTKENGLMIRLMDVVRMFIWTALNILANGEKTSSMDSVLSVPSARLALVVSGRRPGAALYHAHRGGQEGIKVEGHAAQRSRVGVELLFLRSCVVWRSWDI
jgi:hypothetical protein